MQLVAIFKRLRDNGIKQGNHPNRRRAAFFIGAALDAYE